MPVKRALSSYGLVTLVLLVHCKCFNRNLSGLYSCPSISCSPLVLFGTASCTQRIFVTFTDQTFATFTAQTFVTFTSDIRNLYI